MPTGKRTFASDEDRENYELDTLADHETRLDSLETFGTGPDITQIDIGDATLAGATGRAADAGHQHALPAPGTPAASAVGDTGSAGTSAKPSREDHRHGREAFGPVANLTTSQTGADGSSANVSHADHRHGLPASLPLGQQGAPAKIIAGSTAVSAETVVTGLTKSITAGASRKLEVHFTGRVNASVANDLCRLRIRNGLTTAGAELARGQAVVPIAGGSGQTTISFFAEGAFSGAQDFCVTIERAAGTGNVLVAAESTSPAVLTVNDVGG